MRDQVIAVLERHLSLGNYRFSGDSNIKIKCPFHKGGNETKASFSINVDMGLFQCFTCHVAGSIKVLLKMLGLPKNLVDAETQGLKALFDANLANLRKKRRTDCVGHDPFRAKFELPEMVLAAYEYLPTKLVEDGFSVETLQYCEVGFDQFNNRITYPIRDLYGNLAGVAGGRAFDYQEPKYLVYSGKRTDRATGKAIPSNFGFWFDEDYQYDGYEFDNHDYLWGFDRVYPRLFFGKEEQTLVVVEGYKAAMWCIQAGWTNTVALMGSSMSYRQKQLLLRVRSNKIVFFLDNNEAGWEGTRKITRELHKMSNGVLIARYPDDAHEGCQPDDLTPEAVSSAITSAVNYPTWIKGVEHGNR
jgi:DNA primase